jgi:hypothetical protein
LLVKGGVQDVDARHKGEHDVLEQRRVHGFRDQAFGLPRNDGAARFTKARNESRQASYWRRTPQQFLRMT